MQLCFTNSYSSSVSISVMWYSPGTCGDEGNWETRGWWNLNPGDTVETNVGTDNRYFCFYAEAWDGAVWGGPYVEEVFMSAYDGCIGIEQVGNGRDASFLVGFREVDAGWEYWTYVTYTINLV
jgi:uncharacterized membrane protein